MGKAFIIPDVHLKPWMFEEAAKRISEGEYDHIVMLGDLVDDWDNFQILLEREIDIRESLRLNTLRGVDNQNGAFDRLQRARNFIGKIHMARSIDEVQNVVLVVHVNWREFNRDALLAFELHAIEQLRLHLALSYRASDFEHAVSERRFAMIDVSDNAEIADFSYIHREYFSILSSRL